MEIAEALGLRRRAMGARDLIPTARIGNTGPAGPRIAVDDGASLHAREADVAPPCGRQSHVRHAPAALQVFGATVVEKRPWRLGHCRRCSSSHSCTAAAFLSGGKTG